MPLRINTTEIIVMTLLVFDVIFYITMLCTPLQQILFLKEGVLRLIGFNAHVPVIIIQ